MAAQLLLLKDVSSLGRKGDVRTVKPGYARNFLIPKGYATTATQRTLRLQEKLKEERQKQALADKHESEEIAARINGLTLTTVVKVDHEGHMYGSVTSAEIVHLLLGQAHVEIEKRSIQLKHAIKSTGLHSIQVKLKEEVTAVFDLQVMSEEEQRKALEAAKLETAKTEKQ